MDRTGTSQGIGSDLTTSLLHATYRAGPAAVEIRQRWLDTADAPSRVEHIFSLDADDLVSVDATRGHRRVVNPAVPGTVTAVRNWNAAAASATGELLVVIADDLVPPPSWDRTLREVVGALDPRRFAFAVKVADGPPGHDPRPTLLRHPVVSRRFYERWGLFDPRFRGLACDDDITVTAFRGAVVLDGSRLVLEHRHPSFDPGRTPSASQRAIGTADELRDGAAQLRAKWRPGPRNVAQRFFTPPPGAADPQVRAWAWRTWLRAQAHPRRVARATRRAWGRARGS